MAEATGLGRHEIQWVVWTAQAEKAARASTGGLQKVACSTPEAVRRTVIRGLKEGAKLRDIRVEEREVKIVQWTSCDVSAFI